MAEYSDKQLEKLVAGAFKCSPREKVFYGAKNGTFYNQKQYDKLDDKMKSVLKKFENPALKKDDVADEKAAAKAAAAKEEAEKKKAEAEAKKAAKATNKKT